MFDRCVNGSQNIHAHTRVPGGAPDGSKVILWVGSHEGSPGIPWGSYGIHPRDRWVPPRDRKDPPRDPWVPPRDPWVINEHPKHSWGGQRKIARQKIIEQQKKINLGTPRLIFSAARFFLSREFFSVARFFSVHPRDPWGVH